MLKRISCCAELHMLGGDGTVYHADFRNIEDELLEKYRGAASVIYLDPPFGTGGSFEYRRGKKQVAYTDRLPESEYLSMIREASRLSYELLKEDGTFFLHLDYRMSAKCRLICDSIFGEDALTNEIIWAYKSGGRSKNAFSKKHDTILMYRRSPEAYFNIEAVGEPRGRERRNHMKRGVDETGRVFYSIKTGGKEYRYYEDDLVYPSDVWDDIEHLHQRDPERTGFITQKPEALLKRIILSCSREGDLIMDLFGGSGTAAVTAAKLGRRFVSVDQGAAATALTRKRLIERCLKMRLYESVSPLSVETDRPSPQKVHSPEEYFDIADRDGRLVMELKKLSSEHQPLYAAAGTVSGDVFTASDYLMRMTRGEKISIDRGECLHLIDEDLNEGFYINA